MALWWWLNERVSIIWSDCGGIVYDVEDLEMDVGTWNFRKVRLVGPGASAVKGCMHAVATDVPTGTAAKERNQCSAADGYPWKIGGHVPVK